MQQLTEAIEAVCALDLSRASVPQLQAMAQQLQQAAGRLQGRVDTVLGELDERADGQVPARPDDPSSRQGAALGVHDPAPQLALLQLGPG